MHHYSCQLIKFQGKNVSPVWLKEERDRIAREIRDGLRPKKNEKIVKEMDQLIDQADSNIRQADLSMYKKMPESKYYGTLRGSYIRKEIADDIISISKSFNVDAKIVGKVETSVSKKLTIQSEFGEFYY